MKFFILVATVLATAAASWEPVHEKYHGPLHYPKIHEGVPIEPAAVQHAREAHLKALSHASHDNAYEHHEHDNHHDESGHKWHGPLHYPKIHKGVPVEPKEVQNAREAHLNAFAHSSHDDHHYEHNHENYHNEYNHNDGHYEEEHQKKWHGPLHYPKIHKGVPVEPKEVQHAREAHLNALSHASHNEHYNHNNNNQHYRKRRGASSYVHFSSKIEHEVPVYHHEDKVMMAHEHKHHETYNHDNSHGYSIKQTHAPIYGHHEEHKSIEYSPYYEHHHEHHAAVIGHDGTPIDTPEVQHAKEAHFAAHAAAKLKHY